jgi:Right handed beta helix region
MFYAVKLKFYSNFRIFCNGTVIRVSSSSSQWFTGATGIISCKESLKNVEVCGFQIDGNLGALPASYANTPGHNKDCERCIIVGGDSGNYADNIRIHDMRLYNSFSDGINLRFAKNSTCYNNFISNCQHEGIFWTCVENSEMSGNQIAGITSDNARLDNCVTCKVYDNVFFSYDGDETNGAYKHGENGLQVGDAGSSHGYDARNKPTTTTNIEITNNTFANNGLKAILLGAGSDNNVFIHANKFIGVAELETMGISVKGISVSNPPTVQQSEKIFSTIFDILNQNFNSQYLDTETPINASVSITEYNNSYNPHSLVYVVGESLSSVLYTYNGTSTTHYFSINEEKADLWTGDLQHTGGAVYLPGRLNANKLQVTCYNSHGYKKFTDFNITEINDNSSQIFNPQLWIFVGTLAILGFSIYRNLRRVTRW